MAARDKTSLFKAAPLPPARATKADATSEAARLLIAAETRARDTKTARLKELRLAKEREDAEAKAAEASAAALAPKKKKAAKAAE